MDTLIDLPILVTAMEALGFTLVRSEAGTMDSGVAEFSDGTRKVIITKDRSIWELSAPKAELERLGLWRGFKETDEFRDALVGYIKRTAA